MPYDAEKQRGFMFDMEKNGINGSGSSSPKAWEADQDTGDSLTIREEPEDDPDNCDYLDDDYEDDEDYPEDDYGDALDENYQDGEDDPGGEYETDRVHSNENHQDGKDDPGEEYIEDDDYYLDDDYDDSSFLAEFDDDSFFEGQKSDKRDTYEKENLAFTAFYERQKQEIEKNQADFEESQRYYEDKGVEEELSTLERNGNKTGNGSASGKGKDSKASSKKGKLVAGCVLIAMGLGATGAYLIKAQSYNETFCPNTIINGLNAQGMTIEEVKANMSSSLDQYRLRVIGRDGSETVVSKDDIGLHTVFDGTLERLMEEQNPYLWGMSYFGSQNSQVDTLIAYDETMFNQYMDQMELLDPEHVIPYQEAYLSEYIMGSGYEIVPEEPGTAVKKDAFEKAFSEALLSLQPELILEETGCYVRERQEPDPSLVELRDNMNRYATMTVTYTFGEKQEVLNGDEIHKWITFDENNQVSVDETMVSDYVSELAQKYNTAYSTRTFQTSYGPEVEVSGFYGWRINQKAEAEALTAAILAGESQTKEPEYSQTGASHDGKDYGDTYAEVNLTAQHMFLYVDGEKVLESDFVSGNAARGYTTPPGIFGITYKQRDAVLKGQGYASPVKFWMPFNGGIGFHDASWRNQFGGSIYRTNGSHGCINMPYQAAKTLFENIYAGMPVICYNLDGTGSQKSTSASGSGGGPFVVTPETAPAPIPAPLPQEAVPAVTPESSAILTPTETAEPAVAETPAAQEPNTQPQDNQWTQYGPGYQPTQAPTQAPETSPAQTPAPESAAPAPSPETPVPSPETPSPSSETWAPSAEPPATTQPEVPAAPVAIPDPPPSVG